MKVLQLLTLFTALTFVVGCNWKDSGCTKCSCNAGCCESGSCPSTDCDCACSKEKGEQYPPASRQLGDAVGFIALAASPFFYFPPFFFPTFLYSGIIPLISSTRFNSKHSSAEIHQSFLSQFLLIFCLDSLDLFVKMSTILSSILLIV